MNGVVLSMPGDVAPDLSTRGGLERYSRLREAGFSVEQAVSLSDCGYDVIGFAVDLPAHRAAGGTMTVLSSPDSAQIPRRHRPKIHRGWWTVACRILAFPAAHHG